MLENNKTKLNLQGDENENGFNFLTCAAVANGGVIFFASCGASKHIRSSTIVEMTGYFSFCSPVTLGSGLGGFRR